jgi:lipopolysaccharide transport system ATP-binding protein
MTSDNVAIRVSHLSKQYTLGGPQEPYHTIRDAIVNSLKAPMKIFHKAPPVEGFWALKDVSFEVEPGEVVGIIGRNGAGKSTLLKILSRITSPTDGTVELHGRVGSLLEVGTGFHPELTGRENIYLSGSILGMKRREIDAKLDEIVKFSEIEKFLDTPVKRYSSGMYVRLAFAVAAHLEPEILLVDEVLAVGDAAFQKKCLGKMGDVAKEGRTVFFVSHNMSAIASLCERGLLLEDGNLIFDGSSTSAISIYLNKFSEENGIFENRSINPMKKLSIQKITLMKGGCLATQFFISECLIVRIEYAATQKIIGAQIAMELFSGEGVCIFCSTSQDWKGENEDILPGNHTIECPIDLSFFRKGRYFVRVSSSVPGVEILDEVETTVMFEIHNDPNFTLKLGGGRDGIIMPLIKWRELL